MIIVIARSALASTSNLDLDLAKWSIDEIYLFRWILLETCFTSEKLNSKIWYNHFSPSMSTILMPCKRIRNASCRITCGRRCSASTQPVGTDVAQKLLEITKSHLQLQIKRRSSIDWAQGHDCYWIGVFLLNQYIISERTHLRL